MLGPPRVLTSLLLICIAVLPICLAGSSPYPSPAPTSTPLTPFNSRTSSLPPSPSVTSSPTPSFSPYNFSPENPCVPVYTFLASEFSIIINLMRRGVSTSFLSSFYCTFVEKMLVVIKKRRRFHHSVASLCLKDNDLRRIRLAQANFRASHYVRDAQKADPNLFYLPPRFQVPELSNLQIQYVRMFWNGAMVALSTNVRYVPLKSACDLPNALYLFYDPFNEKVHSKYVRYVTSKKSVISAPRLLHLVVAIVLRLDIIGVDRSYSMEILNHCVAFIFNAVRATNLEGSSLVLSRAYIPLYYAVFESLTTECERNVVGEIPSDVVAKVLGARIAQLARFSGWGKTTYLQVSRRGVVEKSYASIIFDPAVKRSVQKLMRRNVNKWGRRKRSFRWRRRFYAKTSARLKTINMQLKRCKHIMSTSTLESDRLLISDEEILDGVTVHDDEPGSWCDESYFFFNPNGGSTRKSQCCSLMCRAYAGATSASSLPLDQCCKCCNEDGCLLDGTTGGFSKCSKMLQSLDRALSVEVEGYGDAQPKVYRISL